MKNQRHWIEQWMLYRAVCRIGTDDAAVNEPLYKASRTVRGSGEGIKELEARNKYLEAENVALRRRITSNE